MTAATADALNVKLDTITHSTMTLHDGCAVAPDAPGLGIEWDFTAIGRAAVARSTVDRPAA